MSKKSKKNKQDPPATANGEDEVIGTGDAGDTSDTGDTGEAHEARESTDEASPVPKASHHDTGHQSPHTLERKRPETSSYLRSSPPIGWRQWREMPSETGDGRDDGQIQLGILFLAFLIYGTQLGFGLWDCWEPHYAETARMMIVRNDWLHPFWSYAYLLSKPILMFWYMAVSMSIFGVSEWAIRLPFALHAVALIWAVYFITSRLFNQRAGLLAALVVGTSPLTTFLGRQALADILVATYMTMALGFFALAIFGHRSVREKASANGYDIPVHLPYLYFAYAMLGLGMLAKGLLGPGLPVIVVAGYIAMSWDWRVILKARLISGTLLMCLIGLPWYLHMLTFPGRNIDDGYTFLKRFIINDNVKRLFAGVHGERGDFVYFIKQLGYASGLWIGFLPLGLSRVARFRTNTPDVHEKLHRFLFSWWLFMFLFFSLSRTKFHHYVYPLIPIGAILIGIWLDRYLGDEDDDKSAVQRFGILMALGLFWLVIQDVIAHPKNLVNMFVYLYSRPYPTTDPMWLGGRVWEISLPFFKGVFRPTPQTFFSLFAAVVAAFMLSGYFYNARRYLVRGLAGVALVWTVYHAHVFMLKLTPHWSQKPLFSYLQKDSVWWKKKLSQKLSNALQEDVPPEPLIAFKMNWRGEKFYSGNRDLQVMKEYSYTRLYDTIKRYQRPGKSAYILIEIGRLKTLKKGVGTYNSRRLRIPDLSPRYKGRGRKRVKLDPTTLQKVRWVRPTPRAIRWFKRHHNKYLLLKLLPKPASEKQTKWQLDADKRRRERDDTFRQRWYYDSRSKKWRKRRWWIREERRRKRAKKRKAKKQKLKRRRKRARYLQKMRQWRKRYLQRRRQRMGLPRTVRPSIRLQPGPRRILSLPPRRPAARPTTARTPARVAPRRPASTNLSSPQLSRPAVPRPSPTSRPK